MSKILFKEEQRFTQWWLWLLLIGIGLIPLIGIYNQIGLDKEFGINPMSNIGLIVISVVMFLCIAFFRIVKLETEISSTELTMKFYPFLTKNVNWEEVASAKIIDYGFVGGWGVRIWTSYGTVYNVKGKKGLAIVLKDGAKFLIGTQNENDLNNVIKEIVF